MRKALLFSLFGACLAQGLANDATIATGPHENIKLHEKKMPSLGLSRSVHRRAIAEAPTGFQTTSPFGVSLSQLFSVSITVEGAGGIEVGRTLPIDVVFSIDSSGSMRSQGRLVAAQNAAKQFVDRLNNETDAGAVVSSDDDIDFIFPTTGLTNDFDALKNRIDAITALGDTNFNVGLTGAISVLDSNTRTDESVEVIIFLTDGTRSSYTFAADGGPASDAASKGYVIYSIGVGSTAMEAPLIDMANATGGLYFDSHLPENLDQIFMEIFMEVLESTIPTNLDVITTTNSYITVDQTMINPPPTSVVANMDGTTTIEWLNIDSGNGLMGGESRVFTYVASSSMSGNNLEVDARTEIFYKDSDGLNQVVTLLSHALINVAEEETPLPMTPPPTASPPSKLPPVKGKGKGGRSGSGKKSGKKGSSGKKGKSGKRNGGGKGKGIGGLRPEDWKKLHIKTSRSNHKRYQGGNEVEGKDKWHPFNDRLLRGEHVENILRDAI